MFIKPLHALNSKRHVMAPLLTYSITHALVDGVCAAVIFANIGHGKLDVSYFSFLVVLYDIIAFALQSPFGFIADKIRKPAEIAASGCLIVAATVFMYKSPVLVMCLAGIGNALFHIGGGIVSLNLKPGKAAMPGIFVAPGAIGLMFGNLFGKANNSTPWYLAVLLLMAAVFIAIVEKPEINYSTHQSVNFRRFETILLLILTSIALRGLTGFMLNYSWKSSLNLLICFTVATAMGKALGGILADRFGWIRTTVSGLLLSSLLLSFGGNYPITAIFGVFLFNLTMPVTLVAVSRMFSGRTGFSFGLTTLALIIGSLPAFTDLSNILCRNNTWLIFIIVLMMSFTLYKGLNLHEKSTQASIRKQSSPVIND